MTSFFCLCRFYCGHYECQALNIITTNIFTHAKSYRNANWRRIFVSMWFFYYVSQASFVVITFKIESVKLKSQSLYIVFSLIYLNDVFSLIV